MDKAEQPTITQALKPCPFCGGEAELRENGYQVHCATGCTANVNDDYAPEAIAAWNTRTTSLAAQVDPIEHVASTNSMFQVMDVDGLNRWREHASEGGGHDMASLNKNSLRRLIGTIDKLAAMASAPSLAAQDGLVEALDDSTIDEIILNFAGGVVQVPSEHNPRGYARYYRTREAMRKALSAIKEQHHD